VLIEKNPQVAACLHLTRAISRTRTVADIYAIALDALQNGLGVFRSAILLFDVDGVMRFKAYRRLSDAYRGAVEGHTPWSPETRDPEPLLVGDVRLEPSLAPLLPAIQAEGIAAMAFVPLVSGGRVTGKFMLYYDAPHTPATDEMELAGVIASQVAFAVERTRAEAQARESEERVRFALDAANMGTWEWDLTGNSLRWSENLERVHGLPSGTFDGTFQSYEREIHPDDRERVLASIRQAVAGGARHDTEYRIVAPDGTIRWVEGKGRVERDADGRPLRMTGVCMNVTARRESEIARIEALAQAHRASQRLAAIVESSGDAIVSKNLDGVVTSWNRAAERMYGYTAAEVIGRSITLVIPPDRLEEETLVLSRIRAGEPVEMETIRRARDGRMIPISLMVSPVKNEDGRIVGASKIARDITDRKQAEAERAELHGRLTALVTASASLLDSPDTQSVLTATISVAQGLLVADGYALWATDPDQGTWRMVKCDGMSEAFAGRVITSPRGTATPFASAWPVTDVLREPLLEAQRDWYRREGIRAMLVCPMRFGVDRAGTLVFYYRAPREFTSVDLETGQTLANLAGAAIATADLHDQLRTERNAAEAARGRAAFLADATAVLSRSLDYEKTLAAVARLAVPEIADWCAVDLIDDAGELRRLAVAHADPDKIEHARMLQARYPDDPDRPDGVHHVVRTGQPAMLESITPELIAGRAHDEEHRRLLSELGPTSYLCVPLVSARGTLGAITFLYAESGRHYTHRDLDFAQELSARATLAIENAFAYRRITEANRVKDEFLATLSHELRTPLNAILGYAQMLHTGVLQGDRYTNAMTVLMRNAQALKQIIDDVLDVARITSGKLRLSVRPLDLAEVLGNAAATIQPAADAKGVTVALVADPDTGGILGDPDRLQQVIWNLLSNAVKFTHRGGRVSVRLRQVDRSVEIVVSDDGQGIDRAFLPHIFERFRQADGRFTREHAGLGLGLAIVRELIELHGGTIAAHSDGPGTGATFTVRFPPMTRPDAPATDAGHARPAVADARPTVFRDRLTAVRILAVDDDEDASGLLRVILESAGADVTVASSAERALELLETMHVDVLIADVGMPGMDGLELIRRIRQTLPAPANRLPAAALTAYARSEDRVTALASGFHLHIAKPVNPDELVAALAELVARNR
jgi:PAS domain S-box-containing protein